MPAFRRYDGNLYRRAMLAEDDVTAPTTRVLIVSAFYGLLDARDWIRHYNLAMSETLPGRMRVHRFWREHGLPEILAEAVRSLGATEVHDLLSGAYRRAAAPTQGFVSFCSYLPKEYPGLGTGSDYYRGSDLRVLLDGGSVLRPG
jgi:cytoplasmic iron level regulating protein YaaA (DUF328/UPF0246 family)